MNKYSNNKRQVSSSPVGMVLLTVLILGMVAIPQRSAAAVTATVPPTQTNYRWRADNGSETTASWATAVNTPIGGINDGDTLRLRFSLGMTSTDPFSNKQAQLEFSSDASNCTTGTWTAVTGATVWKTFDSANFVGPVATTQQISSSGNFIGGYMNDTTNAVPAMTFNSGDVAEYEWAIQANGISAGARYFLRVAFVVTGFIKYSQCAMIMTTEPTATVSISNAFVSGMGVGP